MATAVDSLKETKEIEHLNDDKQLNRFLNISKEAGFDSGSIGVNLSTKGINFMISSDVGVSKVVKFQEFILADFFYGIHNDGIRMKILDNFYIKYPHIEDELSHIQNIDFFELICLFLEIEDRNFDALCAKSLEFNGTGGLKIDAYYSSEGFDYTAFICSILYARLTGAQVDYIVYSLFEAFADFAISILKQISNKFKIENFVMMGDMFTSSVIHNTIQTKFKSSNPYFSKEFALDS